MRYHQKSAAVTYDCAAPIAAVVRFAVRSTLVTGVRITVVIIGKRRRLESGSDQRQDADRDE